MSYIKLQEYKDITGQQNLSTAEETQATVLIAQTKAILDGIIGDLTAGTKNEKIMFSDIFYEVCKIKVYTTNINVSSIISINGEPYTGEFTIGGRLNHIVYIDVLPNTILYPYIDIEMEAGYTSIPDDIKLLQSLMIKDMTTQMSGGDITRKKIGDKELTFSSNTNDNIKSLIASIISSYKIINV